MMETLISLKRSLYRVLYFHKTAELAIDGVHGTGGIYTKPSSAKVRSITFMMPT